MATPNRPAFTNPALTEIQGLFDKVVGSKSAMSEDDSKRLEAELKGLEAKNDPELGPLLAAVRKASANLQTVDAELKKEKGKMEPAELETLQTKLEQLKAALSDLDEATIATASPKKEDVSGMIIKDMEEILKGEAQIAAQKKLFTDPADAALSLQDLQKKYVADTTKAAILASKAFKDAKTAEEQHETNKATHDKTRANFQSIVASLRGLNLSSATFTVLRDAIATQQLSDLLAAAQLENLVAFDAVKPQGDLTPAEATESLQKAREWRVAGKIDTAPAKFTDLGNYHDFVKGGAGADAKKLEAAAEAQQKAFEALAAKTVEKKVTGVDQISRFAAMTADVARVALEGAISRYQLGRRERIAAALADVDEKNGILERAETERLKAKAEAKLLSEFLGTLNGGHGTSKPDEVAAVLEQYGRDQAAKVLGMAPGAPVDADGRTTVDEIVRTTKETLTGGSVNGHFGVSRVALLNLRTGAKTRAKQDIYDQAKGVSVTSLREAKAGLDSLGVDLAEFLEEIRFRFQQMNIELPSAFNLEEAKRLLEQRIKKIADDIATTGDEKKPVSKEYNGADREQLIGDLDKLNEVLEAFKGLLERSVEELEQKAAEIRPTGNYAADKEKEIVGGIIREKRKSEDGKRHKDNISGAIQSYKVLLVELVDMIATFKPALDAAKREFLAQSADTFQNRKLAKTAAIEVTGPLVVTLEAGGTKKPFGAAESQNLRSAVDIGTVQAIVNVLHVEK